MISEFYTNEYLCFNAHCHDFSFKTPTWSLPDVTTSTLPRSLLQNPSPSLLQHSHRLCSKTPMVCSPRRPRFLFTRPRSLLQHSHRLCSTMPIVSFPLSHQSIHVCAPQINNFILHLYFTYPCFLVADLTILKQLILVSIRSSSNVYMYLFNFLATPSKWV